MIAAINLFYYITCITFS